MQIKGGKRFSVAVTLFLILLLMGAGSLAAVQQTPYTLFPFSPLFPFQESFFNDSASSKESDYTQGGGNLTYWISLSRNSTVNYAYLNLTGKITYVYNITATPGGQDVLGISIGNVTTSPGDEIVAGSGSADPNVLVFRGYDGAPVWTYNLTSTNNIIYSTHTGNVTGDGGNEIVFGSEDNKVYVISASDSGGSEEWSYSAVDDVKSVRVADIDGDSVNEVIAGAEKVYVLNDSGGLVCNSTDMSVSRLVIGNVSDDAGQEIVVVSSGWIRVINSSCNLILSKNMVSIDSVAVGNITNDPYDEVAVGGSGDYDYVYLLNSSLDQLWNYSVDDDVRSVSIGDVVEDSEGNEVIAGSNDKRVYTFDNSGDLIWDYLALDFISSVAVGNITNDAGNEVIAGSGDGKIYVFNFDYFPDNVSVDIGGNGTYDWSSEGRLRNTTTTGNLASAFNYHLQNTCTESPCDVKVVIHSDNIGKLNTSGINISFNYNASHVFSVSNVSAWSRTVGVAANESVGNYTTRIAYTGVYPEYQLSVGYLGISPGATECDFNGTSGSVSVVNSSDVCDVPDFTVHVSGSFPPTADLWDNTMDESVPFVINETGLGYTNETDNHYWRKNVTIWKNFAGATVFYNLTANASVDDPAVIGGSYLNASWDLLTCNITPPTETGTCDSGSPSYTYMNCGGDSFYVCKEDTDSDGVVDFFRWIQPNTDGYASWVYQVGGQTNSLANLSDLNVSLNESYWGDGYNFSVFVNDTDGNNVSVMMWYYLQGQGDWFYGGMENISGNGTAWFNLTSGQDWIGSNSYMFQYADFNSSGYQLHSWENTTNVSGPLVTKRDPEIIHLYGDARSVNRSSTLPLIVQINDTVTGENVSSGVQCVFWVMYNQSAWADGVYNATNSSGQCSYDFVPDGNYSTGNLTWKAGVFNDPLYNSTNSTGFNLTVNGLVSIYFTTPLENQTILRNASNFIEARVADQFGVNVNVSGYNCSLFLSGVFINHSETDSRGICNFTWHPQCNESFWLGYHVMDINLSGSPDDNYYIENSSDTINVKVKDYLELVLWNPPALGIYNKGGSVPLNSTVNDTCVNCSSGYNITWYVKWKDFFYIDLNETAGRNRTGEAVVINGSLLQQSNILFDQWEISKTMVYYGDALLVSDVLPWADSEKSYLNESQDYVNNLSDMVFITDLPANTNRTFLVRFNESSSDQNISFIENGGFESGSVSPWSCIQYNCNPSLKQCACAVTSEGSETSGDYSLYLSAESTGTDNGNVMGAGINVSRNISGNYITARYKAWGTFGDGSYARISAGGGVCTLPLSGTTSYASASWSATTCYNASFNGAEKINITVHDYGDGGSLEEASHIYIDYVCISNSSGGCVSQNPGDLLQTVVLSQTEINNETNGTWSVGYYEPVGLRTIAGNASGEFYVTDIENRDIYVYGWSNLSDINISSNHCTYNNSVFKCMQNATLNLICYVRDYNTSLPVYGHNVSYFDENMTFIGSNTTDSGGMALFRWVNSSDVMGEHNWTCNITDDESAFYNDTENNELWMIFNISMGTTNGVVFEEPGTESALGVNTSYNHSFVINMTLKNTGGESMYNVSLSVNTTSGIYYNTPSCPPLLPLETCQRNITVNVTYLAEPGTYGLEINATWQNPDTTFGNASNTTQVYIEENPVLGILQDEINYTISRGGSFDIGNMTVMSLGNHPISDINFTESGNNASDIVQWISYTPDNFSSISKGSYSNTTLSLGVPSNTTTGLYTTRIYANATGSSCSPETECWDYLTLNVNVTEQDWDVNYYNFTKTMGTAAVNGTFYPYLVISNNKGSAYSFNLTRGGSLNYTSLSSTGFTVQPFSSRTVYIYHNTTGEYEEGDYTFNITINNTDSMAVPGEINVSVTLTVINLSVVIITPNTTSPWGPINGSQAVNITVNASLTGNASALEGKMEWYVRVGGQPCSGLSYSFNNTTELWGLRCNAPTLSGNPILADLNVTGHYTEQSLNVSDIQVSSVRYNDITPPRIESFTVLGADEEGNILNGSLEEIIITANITDNDRVNTSWAVVYYPTGSNVTYYLYNNTPSNWTFNFTNPHVVGDYLVRLYANDSSGLTNQTVPPEGYFDVYTTIQFMGYVADKNNNTMNATFSLYKPGTGWRIHTFGTNSSQGRFFNHTLHSREYDIMMVTGQENITFYNASARYSAQSQHNVSDPQNWTTPIRFDYFPNRTSTGISKFTLPNTAKNILLGFAMDVMNMTYSSAYVVIDYDSALGPWLLATTDTSESKFEVLYCTSWDFDLRVCGSGTTDFAYLNRGLNPNISASTFSFPVSGFSAYAIAQACTNAQGDLIDCSGYEEGGDDDVYNPGGGSTGGTSGSSSVAPTTTDTFPFTVTTDIGSIRIHPGENKTYTFTVKNKRTYDNLTIALTVEGLEDLIKPETGVIYLEGNETKTIDIDVIVPNNMGTGTYTGTITATSGTKSLEIPVTMTVSLEGSRFLTMVLDMITKNVDPYGSLRFSLELRNTGFAREFDVLLVYSIKNANTGKTVNETNETVTLRDTLNLRKFIDMSGVDIEFGDYYMDVYAYFGEDSQYSVNQIGVFTVTTPFWESAVGRVLMAVMLAAAVITVGYFGRRWYIKWRLEKARYIFPVNDSKIPQDTGESFWIGKIAETDKKAWFNPDDLTTHALVAGSTGAGKSVSASVFVEEALERKIPVIVFDPTAQWTGFVKALNDDKIFTYYPRFGMDNRMARPYKGLIYEVTDPHININLKKYMVPGEVTVFTLNKLESGEYDVAVKNIVNSVFKQGWEESTSLKMLVVFDEVHRLLEKYGGKGGYVALEKACREFRKWGIGMIMCSQVLADFKEAISGNVLTDIQFNTKSIVDIDKVKSKYGELYAERISRQGVGVGMVQNPKYNEGKPYFVQFRPTWHNPHKISDEDMELYKKFDAMLEEIAVRMEEIKRSGKDTFDIDLEFKLASDKLKRGQFRMAKIYITSLQQHLGIKTVEENE